MKRLKKAVMRRGISAILSAVLFSALALRAVPVSAAVQGTPVLDSILDKAIQEGNERVRLFMETGNQAFLQDSSHFESDEMEARAQAAEMPARFDLREQNRVTPVKFQNPFGTCWGFSIIGAAESSILSKLASQGIEVDPQAFDLSEKHLAWFSAHALPPDSDTGQGGEGSYPGPGTNDGYDSGGLSYFGTTAFASGMGPRAEEEFPYQPKDAENHIDHLPSGEPFCYSADADWSLDEADRFGIGYELEESALLPSPRGVEGVEDETVYRYNEVGTNAIKSELMAGRAVSISFCTEYSRPGEEDSGVFINPETWAHYTYDLFAPANHAVTIVGWDDDYATTNFLEGHQPEAPGAWIVKNSWGAESNQFPNKYDWGLDGYFYLSYYDRSLALPETFDFFTEDTGHDHVYVGQYDYMTAPALSIQEVDTPVREANVFTAEDDMSLRSVAATTSQAGAMITYEIYRLRDGYTSPTDGALACTIDAVYEYAGYHREDLPGALRLRKGEPYSVVVTQQISDGRYVFGAAQGLSRSWWESLPAEEQEQNGYSVGVINPGESFISTQEEFGEEWTDWKDVAEEIISGAGDIVTFDNFAIKTYADPYTFADLADASVTLSAERYTYDGKAKTPGVTVTLVDQVLTEGLDYTVSYKNNTKAGTATVTVTAASDSVYKGAKEVNYTINKAALSGAAMTLSNRTYTYNGKPKTPGVTVKVEGRTLTKGKDYTVSYKDNTKAGTATVIVTAKGDADYTGSKKAAYMINKASQTLRLNVLKKEYRAASLKKKKYSFTIRPSGNKTTMSYKVTKGAHRYISVSKKGVVTMKKGAKKGVYKVSVTAKESMNYKSAKKTVTITVK